MMSDDAVRRYLEARGCRSDIVATGLAGLVDRWERIVDDVVRGYDLTLDDYRNDMDVRDLVAGASAVAAPDDRAATGARLATADGRFRDATEPTGSVWGQPEEGQDPLDEAAQWWYFRRPRAAGPSLARDLAEARLR